MPNIYQLTKKINELLPQVKAKYGLEFKVKNTYTIDSGTWVCPSCKIEGEYDDFTHQINGRMDSINTCLSCGYSETVAFLGKETITKKEDSVPAIEADQIRQILVGLQGVLSRNPEKTDFFELHIGDCIREFYCYAKVKEETTNQTEWAVKDLHREYKQKLNLPQSQAEIFYNRWLGFKGLYFSEPETVLQELVEILEFLIK